jgi:hypothetical protein
MSRPCSRSRRSSRPGAAADLAMTESRTALILTGGGARAGYQVGVLKAIRELLPRAAAQSVSDPVRHLGRRTQRGLAGGGPRISALAWTTCCAFGRTSARIRYIVPIPRASASPVRAGCRRWPWAGSRAARRARCSTTHRCAACWRAGSTSVASDGRSKAGPSIDQHYLLRLFVRPEREFFPGTCRYRAMAAQSEGRRTRRDFPRPPDGIERHSLHLSGRASQPGMVRRRLDAPGRAGLAGDPPRRRQDPGGRRRAHGRRERPAEGRAIPRWRRSPAMRCPASSSTACRSIWSG